MVHTKHQMTAQDLPKVPHDSQSMPRTCWARDPDACTTPWPVLPLIARHHTHSTAHLPPQAYTWVAPWFHAKPTVAWNPDHKPQWLFTTTPTWPSPDPTGIAIRYTMYEPGRTGKHRHPYYPLHHSCHTPGHRTQTLTCRDSNPDTAYILHYIYPYVTQGQPEQGLMAMSPHAKRIISKGTGVYATPILQPNTPVAHLTTGVAIYPYLPMSPCRLPQASLADLLFFTDASGKSALTPITGGTTLQLTYTGGHYHMDHHTGHTTYRASSQGEPWGHGGRHRRDRGPSTRPAPACCPGLVRSGRHCRHTPTPPHSKTTTPQSNRDEPRHRSTAALESPPQPSPLRATSHRETRVPQAPIQKMVRSTSRQYTSALRTCRPSRCPTSTETTHTSNT